MLNIAANILWNLMTICWPLEQQTPIAVPEDYTLKSFNSHPSDTVALMDSHYRPDWDMLEKPWRLKGCLQTATRENDVQYIVGNRSQLSDYTGWNLILRNGKAQLIVAPDKDNCKLFTSTKVYNDQKEHAFELIYAPGKFVLSMDKVPILEGSVPEFKKDSRRRFAIGSLYENAQAKVPFKGKLKNFQLTTGILNVDADAARLDPNLKEKNTQHTNEQEWIDVLDEFPEIVGGRAWSNATDFRRLPERLMTKVRPEVWALSGHSAGMYLQFTLSSNKPLGIRWTLTANNYLPHMCPIGVNGIDVYAKIDSQWRWLTSGRPTRLDKVNVNDRILWPPQGRATEYMIYLPLYTGVRKIEFLMPPDAVVKPVSQSKKPLVFYGTSVVHGCSASRAGMAYPAIVGRHVGLPVINLGFSGHGTLDPEFAEILADIPASAYILDCLPNMAKMDSQEVIRRSTYMVRELRRRQPDTPILLVEDHPYVAHRYNGLKKGPHWDACRQLFEELKQEGITSLYYVLGDNLVGADYEATIDGSHPTDIGMMRFAQIMEPVLKTALNPKN